MLWEHLTMPKLLALTDFAKKGLNSDLLPWDLPGDFLTEMSNMRVTRQKLSPFAGEVSWATLPVDFEPGYLIYINATVSTFWVIAGKDAVYVYDGFLFTDISNVAGYAGVADEDLWSGCLLTNIPIINNPGHWPEYWSPQNVAQPMQYLPWDDSNTWVTANETCRMMRSHKQFLFALDLISQGTVISDGVRWSSPADITGIPETWDPIDTTNVAGLTFLGGSGGRIIDGRSMRDAFVVYRQNGVSIFDYVGGQFVWRVRHLSTTVGVLTSECIAEVKGKHYFISDGDILVNDGNSINSILHNRIRERFTSDFDATNFANAYVVQNDAAKEVWFCVPQSGHTYANIAYLYNWEDDTWSIREIPEGPIAAYGSKPVGQKTWITIGTETWDSSIAIWNKQTSTPLNNTVVLATKPSGPGESGRLTELDNPTDAPDNVYSSLIERTGFALEGLTRVTTITRVFPHIRGKGQIYIQVGSQDYPGADVRWKEAVLFNPNTDRKIDIRTTGELHCFKIYTIDDPTFWEFSGMDIEYVDSGTR